jgi:hypothetical protein
MLGLRYYACDRCDAVHASPAVPPWCSRCDGRSLREITRDLQADAYFWRPVTSDRSSPVDDDP